MTDFYIEREEDRSFAVRRPGSERASAIRATQDEAIEWVRKNNRNARIFIDRVRKTHVGGRDRWEEVVDTAK